MEGREGKRGIRLWWAAAVLIVALAAGGVGYAVGRSGGEDLDQARAEGARKGERAGTLEGTEAGYRQGLRAGKRRAYDRAYRKALKKTLAGGQVSVAPVNRSCGNLVEEGAGTYRVESVDVDCDIARQVARQWEMDCAASGSGSCTVRAGFACTYQDAGYELGRITCTDGDRRVTFETGA